jgi:hypothetical protein
MIRQALRANKTRRVVVVANTKKEECEARAQSVASRIGVQPSRVSVLQGSAEEFLSQPAIGKAVIELVPQEEPGVF